MHFNTFKNLKLASVALIATLIIPNFANAQVTPPPPPPPPAPAPTQIEVEDNDSIFEIFIDETDEDGNRVKIKLKVPNTAHTEEQEIELDIKSDNNEEEVEDLEKIIEEVIEKAIKDANQSSSKQHDHKEYNFDEDEDEDDGESVKSKKLKNVSTRWGIVDVGVSAFTPEGEFAIDGDLDGGFSDQKLRAFSNINWHLFRQRINVIKHHVNVEYGLSLYFDRYNFDSDYRLLPEQDDKIVAYISESTLSPNDAITYDLKRNVLRTTHLTIPLMLNFETNPQKPSRSFRINAGVYGGLRIASSTKQKFEDKVKLKIKDDFNLNPISYGLMAQVGFGPINLYANYGLSDMFNDTQIELVGDNSANPITPYNQNYRTFSAGIVLSPF